MMTELDLKNTLISFSWDEVVKTNEIDQPYATARIWFIKQADEETAWKLIHNWIATEIIQDALMQQTGWLYEYVSKMKGAIQARCTNLLKLQYTIDTVCYAYQKYVQSSLNTHAKTGALRDLAVDLCKQYIEHAPHDYQFFDRPSYADIAKINLDMVPKSSYQYWKVELTATIADMLTMYPDIVVKLFRAKKLPNQEVRYLDYINCFTSPLIDVWLAPYSSLIDILTTYNIKQEDVRLAICELIYKYDAAVSDDDRRYSSSGRAQNLYNIVSWLRYREFDKLHIKQQLDTIKEGPYIDEHWSVTLRNRIHDYLQELIAKIVTKRYVITESEYTVHTKTYIVDVDLSKKKDLNTDEKALAKIVKSLKDSYTRQHTETYTIHKVDSVKILNGDEPKASADTIEGDK